MERLRFRKQTARPTSSQHSTTSPPKHRHDGSSPLPLGMDASPPPQRWSGLLTVWPHDPRTGWSYCVTIPSWVVLPGAKNASGSFINPIVFYKVQIGIQSPQGYSASSIILRRFSDFLKLFTALKRTLPRKDIPAAPPKNSLSRINSSDALLQERRSALEDWTGKLLEDVEISRSAPIASFLELESAARSAVNALSEVQGSSSSYVAGTPFGNTSMEPQLSSHSALSTSFGESLYASDMLSVGYEDGSATPNATSEKGWDSERPSRVADHEIQSNSCEIGHAEDPLEASGGMNKNGTQENDPKIYVISDKEISEKELDARDGDQCLDAEDDHSYSCSSLNSHEFPPPRSNVELLRTWHNRRPSADSDLSTMSLAMETEHFVPVSVEGHADGSLIISGNMEKLMESLPHFSPDFLEGISVVLPIDQRGKVKKIMSALDRRFNIAKADVEELLTRFNQETAMKDFLAAKAQGLESELETIQHKSRMHLKEAVLVEQNRVTELQWGLEESRLELLNVEKARQTEKDGRINAEEKLHATESNCATLRQQLAELHERAERLQKDRDDLEARARSDVRALAKEIKALRLSRQEMTETIQERAKLELVLKEEREEQCRARASRAKLLHEVAALHHRLKECNLDAIAKEDDHSTSFKDLMELLTTSDNRIGLLLAEAQLLAQEDEIRESPSPSQVALHSNGTTLQEQGKLEVNQLDENAIERETRNMLADILVDNGLLRKSMNSLARRTFLMSERMEKGSV